MKNKKILVIGAIISVILIIVGVLFLFKTEPDVEIVKNQKYVIKEWNNFAQRVEAIIENEDIVKYIEFKTADSKENVATGGEYTIYNIIGLKEGKTKVTVNVINPDGTYESIKDYELSVNSELKIEELSVSITKVD